MTKDDAKDYLPIVQAMADGKTIQWRPFPTSAWTDRKELDLTTEPECYRIKLEPIKVPLGPEDVPPGSVFNTVANDTGWKSPALVAEGGVVLLRASRLDIPELKATTWEELMTMGAEIKRPNQDWQPCYKLTEPTE